MRKFKKVQFVGLNVNRQIFNYVHFTSKGKVTNCTNFTQTCCKSPSICARFLSAKFHFFPKFTCAETQYI